MANEFNWSDFAAKLVSEHIESILSKLGEVGGKTAKEFKHRVTDSYSTYLTRAADKYSTTKTILHKNKPMSLYSFYVPLDLTLDKQVYRAAGVQSVTKAARFAVISGTAGTGKSTFLKHLFLDAIRTRHLIPIFFELRSFNASNESLIDVLFASLKIHGYALDKNYFFRGLESGRFLILFDGYDELNLDRREEVRSTIFELCDRYPTNHFVLSSRPDSEFTSWERFTVFTAMPLSKTQALELASKLEYDEEVKERFISELSATLYEKHQSFLSNPLLLTIMLLTYDENAKIPTKTHLFYQQVFEALFNKHDAMKAGGYKRQMFTHLAMDDFGRVLSAVSLQSFSEGLISFDRETLRHYISEAKALCSISVDSDKYIEDLLKSVCLLMKDGQSYVYAHRQFQEYFTALYVNAASEEEKKILFKNTLSDVRAFDVIKILFEINPSLVETMFFLQRINGILRRCKTDGGVEDDAWQFAQTVCKKIHFNIDDSVAKVSYGIRDVALFEFLALVRGCFANSIIFKPTSSKALVKAAIDYARERKIQILDLTECGAHPPLKAVALTPGFSGLDLFKYLIDVRDFILEKQKGRNKKLSSLKAIKSLPLKRNTRRPRQ